MTRVMTVASQKGGVGKTTTIVNLASWFALLGAKVLVVDVDPQSSASACLGLVPEKISRGGMKEVLLEQRPLDTVIYKTAVKNLDVVPSNIWKTDEENALVKAATDDPYILRDAIDLMETHYNYILTDSPPAIVALPIMTMSAADSVIVPLQCEYMSLSTTPRLLDLIVEVREHFNKWLQLEGIVITMYDERTVYAQQIVDEASKQFDSLMFQTIIPRNSRLSESSTLHRPVVLYDIRSAGAEAYLNLAKELMQRYKEA